MCLVRDDTASMKHIEMLQKRNTEQKKAYEPKNEKIKIPVEWLEFKIEKITQKEKRKDN